MEICNWAIGKGRYDSENNDFNNIEAFKNDDLKRYFKSICDKYGNVKDDSEVPIVILPEENELYTYIPIKRVIGSCIQDWNGKLYKLEGLDKLIPSYKFLDNNLSIIKKNPFNHQVLEGISATGKNHRVNEDNYAYLSHPKNKNVKLLVVADGMGGAQAGEKASRMAVDGMVKWFTETNPKLLENLDWLYKNMNRIVCDINKVVYQELVLNQRLNTGTTLACAIINSNYMIYANVGDSRICALQNGKLKLLSIDDSPNWLAGETITIDKLELMRIMPNSNYITQYIGEPNVAPNVGYIANKDYSDVFLFSDGITDCISYRGITKIARDISRKTLFEFIEQSSFGENTPGAKVKGIDDRTVVHYGVRR